MSQHGEIRELLPLYALGALDGTADCAAVSAHLATGCVSCAEELAEHARTASAIGSSLAPRTPRPELRAQLEKRLAAAAPEAARGATVVPFPSRAPWIALAAASIAAMAILSAFYFQDALRQERAGNYAANKRLVDLEAENRALDEELARDRSVLAALQGDAKIFALAAAKDQQGMGRVVWDRAQRKWTLLASGLKPIPAEKAYELWFITGDKKVPAGTFRPDANGSARFEILVPPGLQVIDVAAVTLEPAAGVDAPTGPIVLAGKIT